ISSISARSGPDAPQGDRGEGALGGRHVQHHPLPRPLPAPAVRRGAPARGPVPRSGTGPQGISARRASRQPRREAAQHGPGRPQAVPAADPDDHRVRDARPGGSDGAGRPDRGDGAREGAAGGDATRGLRVSRRHGRRDAARHHRAGHPGRRDPRVRRAAAAAALLRRRQRIEAAAVTPRRTLADREDVLGGVMLTPALAYVILLVGVPFVLAIVLSFSDATAGSLRFGWAGLRNYAAILADPIFLRA